jgi:hypothetical protein
MKNQPTKKSGELNEEIIACCCHIFNLASGCLPM